MAARRTRASDRDSAGRLLRVLGDCELYHMEAAIASLERVKSGIRSESLLKPSDGDDVDVLERTAEGRVLSLSDHKRIARLQAALTTVANAYNGGKKAGEAQEINSRRNLVCAVAGAAVMQATRDYFQSQSTQNVISFTRMFLHQLDHEITQEPIYRLWRQQLSPSVVPLLGHGSCRVRRLALSCLPSLDDAFCIAGLCAGGVRQTDNYSITSALGYLFNTSTQYSREVMTTWFVDACRFGSPVVRLTSEKGPLSPHDLHNYTAGLRGNSKKVTPDDEGRKEKNERLLSLCFGPNGWNKSVRSTNARSHILGVVIRKLFGSPRDTVLLRILREFVGSGWFNSVVFETSGKQLTTHMMNLERLSEDSLNDNSAAAAKTIEGLLFSRLAPLLVLRMLPRGIFGATSAQPLQCGCEDLSHLNEYISRQQHLDDSESEHTDPIDKILFHVLACSVVDPLEFKEVKMLATEALTKFPPPTVLPFVFAYLLAFLRETGKVTEVYEARVQELFESVRPDSQIDELPLQTRICCCNILLSTISRLKSSVLERWKSQGFISRVALATESCAEEAVVAGGLQIIFSFLYKASELIAMENSNDLQLVRNCFETTVSRLESTRNESVAMSGLKVVGALVGKLPSFVSTLPQVDVQRLIDGCLVSLRDRQLSHVVSELAQSLLQAMAPP
ncbi:uncharacterized protein IUM83_00888 [Phytophthora cinnamomi]|uniref:uncharacterized protein n=1 Tax=Phytophthora cinnamomi TaxID=4785 RepID=UPI0035596A49|nr:hypothetical protein IUM83_00888 [Phytophthora cinnamomi]